ncbi:hypothetical protein GCM10011487_32300 [Steroidobacter agaridevorans]|uniref:DUF1566 domain-containing protein n=1 Tax=Steroidobacter agaridevorans TaxID=2695856 RepID=A0A829YDA4_9GAMM|nr:DUF1566 domain-containing protein [Steroidobacter agaridevorans]GFE81230.1 hypothetical protein GCM10011487_32300 [Steroidobacter agaridevorans]
MRLSKVWTAVAALALGGCVDSDKEASFEAGVGGTVTGLSGEVTLILNGSESLRVSTNGSFNFATRLPAETSYVVTIGSQPANQVCAVLGGTGTMPYASINSVVVSCAGRSHAVGGNISALVGSVTLGNGSDIYTTSTDGPFSFATPVTEGAAYAVSVQTHPDIQTCSVSNGAGTMGTSAVENVAVVCSTNTFVIGGTVSGLAGDVVLQNNSGDPITISGNGAFEFPAAVAQGSPYAVMVQTQPATQTCSVSQGAGTVGSGDVSNVVVVCSTNYFNLGGTVSGLNGTVVLQNNGGDNLAITSSGAFTFPSPVAQGSNYSVTVLTQPATQTCTVSNDSGMMDMSDVANVGVSCADNATTLSVTARAVIPVDGTASLTVTNTGASYSAQNIAINLPAGWTDVSVVSSTCGPSLPPLAACTLTLGSPVPYVAQGGIEITGDNVSSSATTAIAFSIDGYLVFSVDSPTSASVIDGANMGSWSWSGTTLLVSGTDPIDGAGNTASIAAQLGNLAPAADACDTSTAGGASVGTWYLPAVCQLTDVGGLANCPAGVPSIHTNLVRLGFRSEMANFSYWSSTQYGPDHAWSVLMSADPTELLTAKFTATGVRCARSIDY